MGTPVNVRVAIIAPPWVPVPPPRYGGTEAVLDGLARGIAAAGHEVLLYTTGDSECPVPKACVIERAEGVGTGGTATELHHVIHAYDTVADYDIVHDHTLTGPLYAAAFREVPVVTTNHGPFESELADLYRAIGDRVPIIAISHHHASTAKDTPIAAVIHHGLDVEPIEPGAGGGPAVFLGRMHPDKAVHIAARIARRAGMPLRIAAKMSEPHEEAYFKDKVEPELGGDVEYIGEVGGQDKIELLQSATCMLNPIAWHEPFGMVMIEAMACGTPVVGTPMGSAPELVDDGVTGFLRDNEEDLAEALSRVDELDRATCRRIAEERFSIERMTRDHLEFYESVIANHRRGDRAPDE